MLKLITSLILCLLIPFVTTCGPGRTIHRKFSSKYDILDAQPPETNEHSISASGPGRRVNRTDPSLDAIMTTAIVFADNSLESPNRLSIKACRVNLYRLAEWVEIHWRKKYKIRVLRGFNDAPCNQNSCTSLHLEGRAFDLDLVPFHKDAAVTLDNKQKLDNLRKFAGLAYYKAGFTFVKVHHYLNPNYVHVSCSEDYTTQGRRVARCFPEDGYVRMKDGKKKLIKDIQVGDEVLTKKFDNSIAFSEVTMIMHRQDDVVIDDYVTISTANQNKLTLSSFHLMITFDGHSKFAKDVKCDDILYTYEPSTNSFVTSYVTNVEYNVIKNGAYAPLSLEGTVVVNDVYTSCYAIFPSHSVSHAAFSLWRLIGQYFPSYEVRNNEYHWYPKILETVVNMAYRFPHQL